MATTPRTAVEFIAHLLEAGAWYPSAIELDQLRRPGDPDGEDLEVEAREIVERAGMEGSQAPEKTGNRDDQGDTLHIAGDARHVMDLVAQLNQAIDRLTHAGVRCELEVTSIGSVGSHARPSVRAQLWRSLAPSQSTKGAFTVRK